MDFEVSKDVVTTVVPLIGLHNFLGLLVVAVFMFLRSDSVLKLFGIGIGLLALTPLMTGIMVWMQVSDADSLRPFGLVNGLVGFAAVVVFIIVGTSDYTPVWRRVALVAAVIWGAVLLALDFGLDAGGSTAYTKAGYVYNNLHAITTVWFLLGWFIAFLEAVHIAVEHSHGEPYRSVLVAAMSMFAVSLAVVMVANENDALRFVNSIFGALMVLVMWVAVVVHERREIVQERADGAAA